VAHNCNPINSGGRDQEDGGLKPAQAHRVWNPVLKILNTNKGWQGGTSGGAPA
jgi:hypothetical protein